MNQIELKKQIEAMIEKRCLGIDTDDIECITIEIEVRPEGGITPRSFRDVWHVPTSKKT